jgi:predicted adenine nucleotide alpha hydrolase (AANH) superfamily ATPase
VAQILRPSYRLSFYFYNPNIHPSQEHQHRLAEMRRLATHLSVPLIAPNYDPNPWLKAVRGSESQPEGGSRCSLCYRLRIENTARWAAENDFPWFTSTLSVSPHKDAQALNTIGDEVAQRLGLQFYSADFKKKDGFKISLQLSEELGLYRQNYCGCCFSQRRPNATASLVALTNVSSRTQPERENPLDF